ETIIDLERMAAAHWRGTEEEWLGDWLLRAAEGFTGRANSALPLGDPGLPLDATLDGLDKGRAVQIDPEPDDAWAARYHYRGQDYLPPIARKVLTSAEDQSFVSIRDGGEVLAIARLSVAGGWGGLTAVEVHPDHRRQRLGAAITAAACQEAARRGASRVFLQVETDNDPAQALYKRLGFRYSHRYHYRVAPLPGGPRTDSGLGATVEAGPPRRARLLPEMP